MRTEYCGLTDARFLGQTVTLFGWAHRRRDHGGVIFIDLRDREGLVQVVCDPDRAETFAAADRVRHEFVLRVTGVVRRRRVDLKALIEARFAVRLHERSVGEVLRRLGFSRVSVRPRHPKADEAAQEAFKKASPSW